MNKYETAPAGAATPTEARETIRMYPSSPAASVYHNIPTASRSFVDHLGFGEDEAVRASELSKRTGLTVREIGREVEAARRAGVPICGNSHGYFIAVVESERVACVRSLRHRVKEIARTAAALEKAELPIG